MRCVKLKMLLLLFAWSVSAFADLRPFPKCDEFHMALKDPEDDTPPWVFGDRLKEEDASLDGRGDFIIASIEASRAAPGSTQRKHWEAKAKKIVKDEGKAWFESLPEVIRRHYPRTRRALKFDDFDRGFIKFLPFDDRLVDHVQEDLHVFNEYAEALNAGNSLIHPARVALDIRNFFRDDIIRPLIRSRLGSRIYGLRFDTSNVDPVRARRYVREHPPSRGFTDISLLYPQRTADLMALPNLRMLHISGDNPFMVGDVAIPVVGPVSILYILTSAGFSKLIDLDISAANQLSNMGHLPALTREFLEHPTHLKRLNLGSCDVRGSVFENDAGYAMLEQFFDKIARLAELEELTFAFYVDGEAIDRGDYLSMFNGMDALKDLKRLSRVNVGLFGAGPLLNRAEVADDIVRRLPQIYDVEFFGFPNPAPDNEIGPLKFKFKKDTAAELGARRKRKAEGKR